MTLKDDPSPIFSMKITPLGEKYLTTENYKMMCRSDVFITYLSIFRVIRELTLKCIETPKSDYDKDFFNKMILTCDFLLDVMGKYLHTDGKKFTYNPETGNYEV